MNNFDETGELPPGDKRPSEPTDQTIDLPAAKPDDTTASESVPATEGMEPGDHEQTTSMSARSANSTGRNGLEETILNNRYKIVRCLGGGGFGKVYEAFDEHLESKVAIKVINSQGSGLKEELLKEGRNARRVNPMTTADNVHVAQVFDVGFHQDTAYMVQELVEGKTLKSFLEKQDQTPTQLLRIFEGVLRGLRAIHGKGVVHRDIKSANIIITKDGIAKIVDLGIGLTEENRRLGEIAGTPHYMSPEQISGDDIDGRTDLYSLGLVIQETLLEGHVRNEETVENIVKNLGKRIPLKTYSKKELREGGGTKRIRRTYQKRPFRMKELFTWDRLKERRSLNSLVKLATWMSQPSPEERPQTAGRALEKIIASSKRFYWMKFGIQVGAILTGLGISFNTYLLNDPKTLEIARNNHALACQAANIGNNEAAQRRYLTSLEEAKGTWPRLEDLFREAKGPLTRNEMIYDSTFNLAETAVNLGEYEQAERYMQLLEGMKPPTSRVANPELKKALEARVKKNVETALQLYEGVFDKKKESDKQGDVRSAIRLADLQWMTLKQKSGEERDALQTKSIELLEQMIGKIKEKSADSFPTADDQLHLALLDIRLGWNLGDQAVKLKGEQQQEKVEETEKVYAEALTIAQNQGNYYLGGIIHDSQAALAFHLGKYEEALHFAQVAVKTHELGEETGALAKSLDTLASSYSQLNQREEALKPALRANRIRFKNKNYREYTHGLYTLAEIGVGLAKKQQATQWIEEGKKLASKEKLPHLLAKFISLEGDLAFQRGEYEQARKSYQHAIETHGSDWMKDYFMVYARIREAESAIMDGDAEAGKKFLPQNFEELEGSDKINDQLTTIVRAKIAYRQGATDKRLLQSLVNISDDPAQVGKAQAIRAKLLTQVGKYKKAENAARLAQNELKEEMTPYDSLEIKLNVAEAYTSMAEKTKKKEYARAYRSEASRLLKSAMREERQGNYHFSGLEQQAASLEKRLTPRRPSPPS